MEHDGINNEKQTECSVCGLRYTQEDCGGGGCPRCDDDEETDEQLRDKWLASFQAEAHAKFTAGIEEHNPAGDKGMARMTSRQLAEAMKDEAIDQYFYACAMLDSIERRNYG
jgi:hypothetical protein